MLNRRSFFPRLFGATAAVAVAPLAKSEIEAALPPGISGVAIMRKLRAEEFRLPRRFIASFLLSADRFDLSTHASIDAAIDRMWSKMEMTLIGSVNLYYGATKARFLKQKLGVIDWNLHATPSDKIANGRRFRILDPLSGDIDLRVDCLCVPADLGQSRTSRTLSEAAG